jgi:Sec7-like guanine-nucleotide exchange factor
MELLERIQSETSPGIIMDPKKGFIRLSGRAIPNDAERIFRPVLDWMNEYIQNPQDSTVFECEMDYFNTSSQKYMADIFKMSNQLFKNGKKVKVIWKYSKEDEDMKLIGEQFQNIIDFSINFVEI